MQTRSSIVTLALLLAADCCISRVWGGEGIPYGRVRERPIAGDPVKIDSGAVSGKLLASGVRAYFGVPLAAPPVRELRWREPQPVPAWHGVLDADEPAPECMQPLRAHEWPVYNPREERVLAESAEACRRVARQCADGVFRSQRAVGSGSRSRTDP